MPHAPFWIGRGLRLVSNKGEANAKVFENILSFDVAVDPASIAANSATKVAVTVTGAKVGDKVLVIPPTALEADLWPGVPYVSAADTVQLPIHNNAAIATDGASRTWTFILLR